MRHAPSCLAAAVAFAAGCREPTATTASATVTVLTADDPSETAGGAEDAGGTTFGPLLTTTADVPESTSGAATSSGEASGEASGETSSTGIPAPTCGDGIVAEGLEQCDPPSSRGVTCDYCTEDCKRAAFCGDGELQSDCGEMCEHTMLATVCDMQCEFTARTVFVTSVKYSGDLGGVEGAHQKCAERAQAAEDKWAAAHPGEPNPWKERVFRAWISDGGAQNCPAKFLDDSGDAQPRPYHLPGGQDEVVAVSTVALAEGPLRPIDRDEFGVKVEGVETVWSNTKADGTPLAKEWDCMQWSFAGPPDDCDEMPARCGAVGRVKLSSWTDADARWPCGWGWFRLYCFEQSIHQQKQTEMNAPCPDPG